MRLSVIVPVWRDTQALEEMLRSLERELESSPHLEQQLEIIVVPADDDVSAGSTSPLPDTLPRSSYRFRMSSLLAPRGRGLQLAAGAGEACGEWLWFLHVDSKVPLAAIEYLCSPLSPGWGRFDVHLDVDSVAGRLIASSMNVRSRLTGICTGDQGIFVHRALLDRVGGVPQQPLMEDVELSRRLRRICRPHCPRIHLTTSARRWMRDGIVRTILRMWVFRLRYWAGASPEVLARDYYPDSATHEV